ncbi:MAG: metal-dependent hydrolase [Thermoplasmata archaeon]
MRQVTHILTGAAVGALFASLFDFGALDFMILGGVFGTAPDLDVLFSGFGRRVHRSAATHSIVASVGFAIAWIAILIATNKLVAFSPLDSFELAQSSLVVFLSTFLHAAEDSVTVYGCRILYPISMKVYRGVVKYDDWAANTALFIIGAAVILLCLEIDLSSMFV